MTEQDFTPFTEDGPLYPPVPIPLCQDLTNGGRAGGQLLLLGGRVCNYRGQPVADAKVEIWQADSNGYYDHPRARGADALDEYWMIEMSDLDPDFAYFGSVETGEDGSYWLQTIVPRWYHVFGTDRAAHIHMKVWSVANGVLTTEIYFPGAEHEKRRHADRVYQGREQQPGLVVNYCTHADLAMENLPRLEGARYCRRDINFL